MNKIAWNFGTIFKKKIKIRKPYLNKPFFSFCDFRR